MATPWCPRSTRYHGFGASSVSSAWCIQIQFFAARLKVEKAPRSTGPPGYVRIWRWTPLFKYAQLIWQIKADYLEQAGSIFRSIEPVFEYVRRYNLRRTPRTKIIDTSIEHEDLQLAKFYVDGTNAASRHPILGEVSKTLQAGAFMSDPP